jgi:hypothetical protein
MTPASDHPAPCGCPRCRSRRQAIDRLARSAIRRLEAETGTVRPADAAETAPSPGPMRTAAMALPGLTVSWGPPVRIPAANADAFLAGRAGPLPASLRRRFCLYAIELDGQPVYVGMAPSSTVASRLRAHLALARRPVGPRGGRGDLARLQPILARALGAGRALAARVGVVPAWGPYSADAKTLHAAEALAANLLLARGGAGVAYDPATWTFEAGAAPVGGVP